MMCTGMKVLRIYESYVDVAVYISFLATDGFRTPICTESRSHGVKSCKWVRIVTVHFNIEMIVTTCALCVETLSSNVLTKM